MGEINVEISWNDLLGDDFGLMTARILFALVLSGLIGFERGLKNHSAGFRTHILVGVGSCLMMLLSLYGFRSYVDELDNVQFDPARIPSYVISGIGFLGAGTIIVNGMTIRGLTTAASIWAVAGIGLVVGAGMYSEAVLTTVVILLSLVFLNNFEKVFSRDQKTLHFRVEVTTELNVASIIEVFDDFQLSVKKIEIETDANNKRTILIDLEKGQSVEQIALFDRLSKIDHVSRVHER